MNSYSVRLANVFRVGSLSGTRSRLPAQADNRPIASNPLASNVIPCLARTIGPLCRRGVLPLRRAAVVQLRYREAGLGCVLR